MSYQLSDKNANFTIFKESVMSAKIAHFSELSNILGDNNSMCNIFFTPDGAVWHRQFTFSLIVILYYDDRFCDY